MKIGIVLSAALFLLLSGCAPHAREPEGLSLVRVLGVDGGNEITLTAVCSAQGGETVRGTARAADFCAARDRLPGSGEQELALTNLSYIVVNEETELREVLLEILRDQEMSPSATVWVADCAQIVLEGSKDPAGRLEVLSGQGVEAPTVVEVLARLETAGAVRLPVLEMEQGMLCTAHTVLWEGEK